MHADDEMCCLELVRCVHFGGKSGSDVPFVENAAIFQSNSANPTHRTAGRVLFIIFIE